MTEFGIIGLAILLVTFFVSYKGFKDSDYFNRYAFRVADIRYGRQYYRLLTSGLLHTGWAHLIINGLTFYWFSSSVEAILGYRNFLILYIISLLGGNLLSLLLHRNDGDYTAVGASGAISGLVFAAIALFPEMEVGMLDFSVSGWLYGMLYVLYSAYGITARRDNIGHDAHLGGGLVGLATAVVMLPELLLTSYVAIAAILAPTLAFFYLLVKKPEAMVLGNIFRSAPAYQTVDDKYHARQQAQAEELDRLLDKINHKGLESLNTREKKQLEKLSR